MTIPVGQSASFFCSAVGNPLPEIEWYRGEDRLTAATPRVSITGSTLSISQIVIEDRDYYTCRAVFPSGTTEARAFLNILSESRLLLKLRESGKGGGGQWEARPI